MSRNNTLAALILSFLALLLQGCATQRAIINAFQHTETYPDDEADIQIIQAAFDEKKVYICFIINLPDAAKTYTLTAPSLTTLSSTTLRLDKNTLWNNVESLTSGCSTQGQIIPILKKPIGLDMPQQPSLYIYKDYSATFTIHSTNPIVDSSHKYTVLFYESEAFRCSEKGKPLGLLLIPFTLFEDLVITPIFLSFISIICWDNCS